MGPAGRELERALEDAGIECDDAYVTNDTPLDARVMGGVHQPSSILRQPTSEDRERARDRLVENLRRVAHVLTGG